jgi:predicted nucleotidyltransferase
MSATLVGSGLRKRQAEIPSVIRQIRKHVDLVRATLLLVGSMARGTETQWSDIDFLVISEGPKPIWTI